eukprot:TRINITY_DN113524_c0_g1_i1.p2 TRINITY_DN113524_c0_g1~~TRINITY_DN113524_c0_g1_i1.p2  ORF type:complete len:140 (-),score=34.86 TRINITY_DN113524_c0_g1_i1:101-520(-)
MPSKMKKVNKHAARAQQNGRTAKANKEQKKSRSGSSGWSATRLKMQNIMEREKQQLIDDFKRQVQEKQQEIDDLKRQLQESTQVKEKMKNPPVMVSTAGQTEVNGIGNRFVKTVLEKDIAAGRLYRQVAWRNPERKKRN